MKNKLSESQLSHIIHESLKPRLDDFRYNHPGILRHTDEVEMICDYLLQSAGERSQIHEVPGNTQEPHFDADESTSRKSLDLIIQVAILKAKINDQAYLNMENIQDAVQLLSPRIPPFALE